MMRKLHKRRGQKGFTLIELMIVIAIIGILAAIAIPKFANLINKSKEGATKGALSTVRSAIQVYYGDNEGWFPTDTLTVLSTNGKYINAMPVTKLPGTGHSDNATVVNTLADGAGWMYYANSASPTTWGNFVVNCSHKDIAGQVDATAGSYWTAY